MAKIVSLNRKTHGMDIPANFEVGMPTMEGGPPVASINLYATGIAKGDVFIGPCYAIRYKDSEVGVGVPMADVVDVAYVSTAKKKEEGPKAPDME